MVRKRAAAAPRRNATAHRRCSLARLAASAGALCLLFSASLAVAALAGGGPPPSDDNPDDTYSFHYLNTTLGVAGPGLKSFTKTNDNVGDVDIELNKSLSGSGEFGGGDRARSDNHVKIDRQKRANGDLRSVNLVTRTRGFVAEGGNQGERTPTVDSTTEADFEFDVQGDVLYSILASASASNTDTDSGSCAAAEATLNGDPDVGASGIVFRKDQRVGCVSAPPSEGAASGTLTPGDYDVELEAEGAADAETAGAWNYSAAATFAITFQACEVTKTNGVVQVIGPEKRGGTCAAQCLGRALTMPNAGTSGNDTIVGTNGPDVIDGREGEDTIRGRDGNDRICGGSENDKLTGGVDSDMIEGGSGADEVNGNANGDPIIRGEAGGDVLEGASGDDTIEGGSEADVIAGGVTTAEPGGPTPAETDFTVDNTDRDTLRGDDGDDIIGGGDGPDVIRGGSGENTFFGHSGSDQIHADTGLAAEMSGGGGDDTLTGGVFAEEDFLYGDAGEDTIQGLGGGDFLYGGDEHDTILGGDDPDSMNGGPGPDRCDGEDPEPDPPDPGPLPTVADLAFACQTVISAHNTG